MKVLLLAPLACLIVCGCSPDIAATDPATQVKVTSNPLEKPLQLLPLTVGNAWTFEIQHLIRDKDGTRRGEDEATLKVTGRKGNTATIAYLREDKIQSEVVFQESETGVGQSILRDIKGQERKFTPAVPIFSWPMKPGDKKEWKGTGYRPALESVGPMTSTLTYKGESEVDTPAGRFKAYRFDTTHAYKDGSKTYGSTTSTWFVPKIGIVRTLEMIGGTESSRETELKLKSYTVK